MQEEKPVISLRIRGPLICFSVLTILNALFWFTADFESFAPPSPGVFEERLYFFGLIESGPLALFFIPMTVGSYVFAGVIIAVVVVLLFLYVRRPQSTPLGCAMCIAIVVWFFMGFAVAGLRIT